MSTLAESVEHFRARVLQDALSEATANYWRRRARMLDWAMPKPGEFHGRATRADLEARCARLRAEAAACRNRAAIAELGGAPWPEVGTHLE